MKNYSGHRLNPWLGRLMVSRQETARPLLTPGEVMQLPPTDEIVMAAGTAPIRAKKVRYYEDRRFPWILMQAFPICDRGSGCRLVSIARRRGQAGGGVYPSS